MIIAVMPNDVAAWPEKKLYELGYFKILIMAFISIALLGRNLPTVSFVTCMVSNIIPSATRVVKDIINASFFGYLIYRSKKNKMNNGIQVVILVTPTQKES